MRLYDECMSIMNEHFIKEFNLVKQISIMKVEVTTNKYKLSDLKFKCLQDMEYIEEY